MMTVTGSRPDVVPTRSQVGSGPQASISGGPGVACEGGDSFSPSVRGRLDSFLAAARNGEMEHPTAVFDFDGTLCRDDIGERFLHWQIDERKLQGVDYQRDIYHDYEMEVKRDAGSGYAMAVTLMKGLEEKSIREWADGFSRDHVDQNAFAAQRELVHELQQAGVDVWIVSASSQYLVEAAAPSLGIAPDHAIGIQAEVQNGILTGRTQGPITYRQGKVEAIDQVIGRTPDFAAGNSMTDYEMLESASHLALVINPAGGGPDSLRSRCEVNGWAVQDWPA